MDTEHGYEIAIIGRHLEVTEAIRKYAEEKLAKIERFTDRIIEAHITLEVIKLQHRCDIVLNAENTRIAVHGIGESIYAAIDQATDRLKRKLDRYRKRLHEHHAKGLSTVDLEVQVVNPSEEYIQDINDQIEEVTLQKIEGELKPHEIVSQDKMLLKTLTSDEALMKMELSHDRFMLYRDEVDGKLRIIYRREDDNFGIVEVE
jgi:ribosome hibernation promoting factor